MDEIKVPKTLSGAEFCVESVSEALKGSTLVWEVVFKPY